MSEQAKLIGSALLLVVKDVVKTAEYYRDVLGFEIIGYFPDPLLYSMVKRDDFQVHFSKADGEETKTNADFRKAAVDFMIWVPEIHKFHEEVTSRGAEVAEGIARRG